MTVKIPTVEEARQYIDELDFSKIIKKMVKHQGWTESDAILGSQVYKNFFFFIRNMAINFPKYARQMSGYIDSIFTLHQLCDEYKKTSKQEQIENKFDDRAIQAAADQELILELTHAYHFATFFYRLIPNLPSL